MSTKLRSGYQEYDPNTISIYRIKNVNYDTLSNVNVRVADHSDYKVILSRDNYIDLAFGIDPKNSNRTCLKYAGHVVQQVDFNNGDSSDDLTMPGYGGNDKGSGFVLYNAANVLGSEFEVLNFTRHEFLEKFSDINGIDQHPSATFKQSIVTDGGGVKSIIELSITK